MGLNQKLEALELEVYGEPIYRCLWCDTRVAEAGDACNLVCYSNAVQAINLVTYLEDKDQLNDLQYQPWYPALANTQEG